MVFIADDPLLAPNERAIRGCEVALFVARVFHVNDGPMNYRIQFSLPHDPVKDNSSSQ